MATNITLKPGNTLTVTAGATKASVQSADGAVLAFLSPGFAQTFGPYLVQRVFAVSDDATAVTAEYTTSIGSLLFANAGAPVTAVAASANVNPTGDDNGLTFTAKTYGASGNSINIRYNDPAANDASLTVAVAGPAITVSLATGEAGAITSTAAEVKAAIDASAAASALVSVAVMTSDSGTGDDGSGVVTAMAATSLASGVGTGIGAAAPGALCIDTTNADVYRNDGTTAAPTWVKVGDAA